MEYTELGNALITVGSILALWTIVFQRPSALARSCLSESAAKWELCYGFAKQQVYGGIGVALIALGWLMQTGKINVRINISNAKLFFVLILMSWLLSRKISMYIYFLALRSRFEQPGGDDGQLAYALSVCFNKKHPDIHREGLKNNFKNRGLPPWWRYFYKGALLNWFINFDVKKE